MIVDARHSLLTLWPRTEFSMFSFGKPTPKSFANQLLKAIRAIDPTRRYVFDEENFKLVRQDEEGIMSLSNIFAEHCQLPRGERNANIQRLAQAFTTDSDDAIPDSFDEARPHLRPKIYNRATFEFMELQARLTGKGKLDIPLYPLGDHLYGSLVYDTENAMISINNERLENWGANYYEAFEIACDNLAESSIATACIGEMFYSAMSGDNYDSSRVFLIDRLRKMEVNGDHVAMVPQRDALYITGSDDIDGLRIMIDFTRKTMEEEPRPLSPIPLRLVDGQWQQWTLPADHELRSAFDNLQRDFFGSLYYEQQQLLNALHEAGEELPFVASYSGLRNDEENLDITYCVWGEGVDSLLPKTEYIVLPNENGVQAAGKWDEVAKAVGPMMRADDSYYPTRYRCMEFPGEALLQEIGRDPIFGS